MTGAASDGWLRRHLRRDVLVPAAIIAASGALAVFAPDPILRYAGLMWFASEIIRSAA